MQYCINLFIYFLKSKAYVIYFIIGFLCYIFCPFEIGVSIITFELLAFYFILYILTNPKAKWYFIPLSILTIFGLLIFSGENYTYYDYYLVFLLILLINLLIIIARNFIDNGILNEETSKNNLLKLHVGLLKISPIFIHEIIEKISVAIINNANRENIS